MNDVKFSFDDSYQSFSKEELEAIKKEVYPPVSKEEMERQNSEIESLWNEPDHSEVEDIGGKR